MTVLEQIAQSLIDGDEHKAGELVRLALADGIGVSEIVNKGLIGGMNEVGVRFKAADMFLPEVLLSARAMKAGMEIVKPLLLSADFKGLGKLVLGTVKGDIHDMGKNLVSVMLGGAGFEVIDIGIDVTPEKFIQVAVEQKAPLIAMSALLSVTMPFMKETIDALKKAGLQGKVKTLVGGALVTQRFADEIGADGFAPDAPSAVAKAKELLKLS